MTFKELLRKFTSRKVILSVISLLTGVGTLFFEGNSDFSFIASLLLIGVPSVVYCIVEGKIDKENVKGIIDKIAQASEEIDNRMKNEQKEDDNEG